MLATSSKTITEMHVTAIIHGIPTYSVKITMNDNFNKYYRPMPLGNYQEQERFVSEH